MIAIKDQKSESKPRFFFSHPKLWLILWWEAGAAGAVQPDSGSVPDVAVDKSSASGRFGAGPLARDVDDRGNGWNVKIMVSCQKATVVAPFVEMAHCLVGGDWTIFPHDLGMSSSQLTFIFLRGVQTTNQSWFILVHLCGKFGAGYT